MLRDVSEQLYEPTCWIERADQITDDPDRQSLRLLCREMHWHQYDRDYDGFVQPDGDLVLFLNYRTIRDLIRVWGEGITLKVPTVPLDPVHVGQCMAAQLEAAFRAGYELGIRQTPGG